MANRDNTRSTASNRPSNRFGLKNKDTVDGILFALPYLVAFCVFLLYPLLKGLYMSLFHWNPLAPSQSQFVGLQNYVEMVQNPYFWQSFWNTLYFVILTVPSMVIVSLALALGVNRKVFGKRALRAIYFSPYILTVSIVALIWQQLTASGYGVINYYLGAVMKTPPDWLGSPLLAMPVLSTVTVWWILGFNFVIFLAARQGIPERLYEAARLDGAGTWRAFRDITLPQMRNSIAFVVIIQFILQFQVFGQPYILTNGGPGKKTRTIVMYLYQAAFSQQNFGYAAAVGYFLFAVLVVVSFINYRYIGGSTQ